MAEANHPGYKVTGALVVAADVTGKLRHCYRESWIPWLNDVQRAHFLRHGLVEELQSPESSVATPADQGGKPAKTAGVDKWVDYGVGKLGEERRDELAALGAKDKQELIGLLS